MTKSGQNKKKYDISVTVPSDLAELVSSASPIDEGKDSSLLKDGLAVLGSLAADLGISIDISQKPADDQKPQ